MINYHKIIATDKTTRRIDRSEVYAYAHRLGVKISRTSRNITINVLLNNANINDNASRAEKKGGDRDYSREYYIASVLLLLLRQYYFRALSAHKNMRERRR